MPDPFLLLLAALSACSSTTCPAGMVAARGRSGAFCIHAWELHVRHSSRQQAPDDGNPTSTGELLLSRPGLIPTRLTWKQASDYCAWAGFHLCTSAEWEDACDGHPGPGGEDYPTVDGGYHTGQCGVSDYREGFRPSLLPTGSYPQCHTATGIYDMLGNLWEWADPQITDEDGTPIIDKRGAAHYSGSPATCAFNSPGSHSIHFKGTIGFRCCSDPLDTH